MNYFKAITQTQYLIGLLLLGSLSACSKMNGTYADFVKDGAIVYPGKADSLTTKPGKERMGLSWILSDPAVRKCVVYWNQQTDSLVVPIEGTRSSDTIDVVIADLPEGSYAFTVWTYDEDGNPSVRAEASGEVYGEAYASTLTSRFIDQMRVDSGKVIVTWTTADEGTLGEQIQYTDRNGVIRERFVPASDSAVLTAFRPGGSFRYTTLYTPDSLAIDTFYSATEEATVDAKLFETMLDKSLFKPYHLLTDTDHPHGAANTVDKIWDGVLNTEAPTFLTDPGSGFPQWFTFDLGVKAQLSRLKYYQRGDASNTHERLFEGGNIKTFEVWGSNDPNPNGDWDDSWTLLLRCESQKPSGSPEGVVTQQDIDYALAGEEFLFEDTVPAVRYIRIKTYANWDLENRSYVNIGELTFWANTIE